MQALVDNYNRLNYLTEVSGYFFKKVREVLSALHEGDVSDKDLQDALKEAKQAAEHLKTFLKKYPETSVK